MSTANTTATNATNNSTNPLFRLPIGCGYLCLQVLGEGAYGQVCAALDRSNRQMVAIKRILPFDHRIFCLRTLRELTILRYLRNSHPNIINLLDVILPDHYSQLAEVLIVQQKMDCDLHRVIRLQTLSDEHCKYFSYQLLKGVEFLHSLNILHRDLKPSNIFVNANCELRIGDFGLARFINSTVQHSATATTASVINNLVAKQQNHNRRMTEYVATRWYRAPEIIIQGQEVYTAAIDLWSVGCVMAEMITGRPLFPGKSFLHQLALLTDYTGTLSSDEMQTIRVEKAKMFLEALPPKSPHKLADLIAPYTAHLQLNPVGLELVESLLSYHADQRPSASSALLHPYLAQYRSSSGTVGGCSKSGELLQTPPLTPPPKLFCDFDRNRDRLSREDLKQLIWKEMKAIKQDCLSASMVCSPSGSSVTSATNNKSKSSSSPAESKTGGVVVAGRVSSANL